MYETSSLTQCGGFREILSDYQFIKNVVGNTSVQEHLKSIIFSIACCMLCCLLSILITEKACVPTTHGVIN
jgi:hypothetical protein